MLRQVGFWHVTRKYLKSGGFRKIILPLAVTLVRVALRRMKNFRDRVVRFCGKHDSSVLLLASSHNKKTFNLVNGYEYIHSLREHHPEMPSL